MDQRSEVAEFLRTRRDRIAPAQAGILPGSRRRVPGLRRQEVALLTGVSVEYYARMERGDLYGVSPEVLDSLARTLQLDEPETEHLHDLARAATPRSSRPRKKPSAPTVRPSLQRLLDGNSRSPMWIRDRCTNIITTNPLARALYAPILQDRVSQGNTARFIFFNPHAEDFFPEWDYVADEIAATMRNYAGKSPRDKNLTDLIGELVTRSDEFRTRWGRHQVRFHRLGVKRIHHPLVGDLQLDYEALDLPADPGWFLFGHTAEPGSETDERLQILGSLAAEDPSAAAEGH